MVNVEEGALGAFEQNVITAAQCFVEQNDGIGDKALQIIARRAIFRMDLLEH